MLVIQKSLACASRLATKRCSGDSQNADEVGLPVA